jgi:hypothetical protein
VRPSTVARAARGLNALRSSFSEADSYGMPPEAGSKRLRGRPPVFSDAALRRATDFSYAKRVRSRRGEQDLVYRMFAVAAIELYRETHPETGARLEWLLSPRRRHVLLTELGRIAKPKSDSDGTLKWNEMDVSHLIAVALEIADSKPSTKDGVARIREIRKDPRSRESSRLSTS